MAQLTAPVITCSRLRMQTDGQGVTTLVCFHGCPLRCKWCINAFTLAPDTRYRTVTPLELYEKVKVDGLYFVATGGGVTFGGGEPLLQAGFIKEFRQLCGQDWHICAETSLNVPWENVELAATAVDLFIIDCKDTDPGIYKAYTGKDNAQMLKNLQKLLELIGPDRIVVRVPLIPEYNTEENRAESKKLLEAMGIQHFDLFAYTKAEG